MDAAPPSAFLGPLGGYRCHGSQEALRFVRPRPSTDCVTPCVPEIHSGTAAGSQSGSLTCYDSRPQTREMGRDDDTERQGSIDE